MKVFGRTGFQTLVLVVVLSAAASVSDSRAREFRAADAQNEDYPTVQALRFLGSQIHERTSGRHGLKVFHSRQLGEEKETLEQTRVGTIDLNRINLAVIGGIVSGTNVLALPFLFRSIEHMRKVLDGPIGVEILGTFEQYGFVGLAFYDSGARSIYNRARPVRALADLKGLRIRVQQSGQMSDMMRALGAIPVELPYGQVLTGIKSRQVDGAEDNWPSFVATNHHKHAGYYTLTEHTMSPEVLVMSLKAWETLTPDDRKIFREEARRSSQFMREKWRDLESQSRKQAQAAGVDIVTDFERKPFEDAMAGIYARAQRDPASARLIERIRGASAP